MDPETQARRISALGEEINLNRRVETPVEGLGCRWRGIPPVRRMELLRGIKIWKWGGDNHRPVKTLTKTNSSGWSLQTRRRGSELTACSEANCGSDRLHQPDKLITEGNAREAGRHQERCAHDPEAYSQQASTTPGQRDLKRPSI